MAAWQGGEFGGESLLSASFWLVFPWFPFFSAEFLLQKKGNLKNKPFGLRLWSLWI